MMALERLCKCFSPTYSYCNDRSTLRFHRASHRCQVSQMQTSSFNNTISMIPRKRERPVHKTAILSTSMRDETSAMVIPPRLPEVNTGLVAGARLDGTAAGATADPGAGPT